MRAACIQLCSGTTIAANLAETERWIRRAAHEGCTLITTPEMTHLLQRSPKKLFAAIKPESEDLGVARFAALADELSVYLLIGSLAILTGARRAANRSFFFGPDGQIIARYDKIHMFDVNISRAESWKESAVYDAGTKAVIAPCITQGDKAALGLSVCYDVRFADLYKAYAQRGANIMTVPAAFTRPTGEAHWQVLLRARAIETGSYVLAPAQGGTHEDGRATWGRSMIIGPWGEEVAKIDGDTPGMIWADLDLDKVDEARRKIPAWSLNEDYSF